MKRKFISILLTLVLVLTLGLVTAVPASANPGGIELVELGDATAEWTTEEANSGSYSVKLTAGAIDWVDWAGVQIPVGGLFSDMSAAHAEYGFYYKTDGTASQTPAVAFVFEVGGETWKLVEYFTSLETSVTDWTSEGLKDTLFLMKGSTNLGTAEYWGAGNWIPDMGTGFVHQDLSAWQLADVGGATLGSRTVDKLGVSIGALSGTVYVDDVTIDNVTYDLEAPSGTVDMSATYPAPVIGISVSPGSLSFGDVYPDEPSDFQMVTVTNTGNVAEDFSASIINEWPIGVYTAPFPDGLTMQTTVPTVGILGPVSTWEELDVQPAGAEPPTVAGFVDASLVLTVPEGTAPGHYSATLIVWAEMAD